jgi:hypothetical protein
MAADDDIAPMTGVAPGEEPTGASLAPPDDEQDEEEREEAERAAHQDDEDGD